MGEFVLLIGTDLSHRTVEALWNKDRIVAEARFSSRRFEEDTLTASNRNFARSIGPTASGHAVESSPTGGDHAGELREQVFESPTIIEPRSAIARRIGAGRPSQCLDLESGIVGNAGQPDRTRRRQGLCSRVLCVVPTLFREFDGGELSQRQDLVAPEEAADFAAFAHVLTRHHDPPSSEHAISFQERAAARG